MVHGSDGLVFVSHEQMLSNARDVEVKGPFLFDSELDRVGICALRCDARAKGPMLIVPAPFSGVMGSVLDT
jgi:hypothetical protein